MKRTYWTALGIACASILLAGCQMNVITKVDSSGAGTLTTEVGMTPDEVTQLQSLGGETGSSPCSSFSAGQTGAANAPAFEEEMRGEDTWCVAKESFENLDELAALYQEMGFVKIRELTLREGLLVYDLEVDTQGSDEAMTAGEMTWVLELPGKVGSHNADSVEGKRLTWTLETGTVTEVQASSDLSALSLPFSLGGTEGLIVAAVACACCGGVLVVVVVVVVLLLKRKGRGSGSSKPSETST
jgi:hypothetical protein